MIRAHICPKMVKDATVTFCNISERITSDEAMNRDHISATTTYVMREERLWNVGVLQSVRVSNVVDICRIRLTGRL
jgi:hypothetical protein